jgi:DNA-binding protein Fis
MTKKVSNTVIVKVKSMREAVNLYGFTYPAAIKELIEQGFILVKIGDSTRDTLIRIKEQGDSSEWQKKIVLRSWNDLKVIKSDKEFHRILKKSGIINWVDGKGKEWFKIPGNTVEEAVQFLDNFVTKIEGRKVRNNLVLRVAQQNCLDTTLKIVNDALKRNQQYVNVVAHLCPRSGKTIFSLASFAELIKAHDFDIMLVPAYWLGVHSSFASDLDRFADFNNFFEIDVNNESASEIASAVISKNGKIIVPISLHGDETSWKEKHKWIAELSNHKVFNFFDEGDFGTHTDNQQKKIEFLLNNETNTYVNIFASGTNIQRLAKCTRKIDGVVYLPYAVLEQTDSTIVRRKFYGTNVSQLKAEVESTLANEVMATWDKIWNKPLANRAMIEQLFISLVGGNELRSELNLNNITGEMIDCFMIFTSANIDPMNQVAKILRQTANQELQKYEIVVLNSENTTNRNADNDVETIINQVKNKTRDSKKTGVIIITNNMGSRSFNPPEIQASVLAFDRGSVDAASQKASRCLTPTREDRKLMNGEHKTHGHIIDLSFDPNRNENLERMVIDESIQIMRSGNAIDLPKATRYYFNSVNMFKVNSFGYPEPVTEDDMFTLYSDNEILLKVADVSIDIDAITDELLDKMSDFQSVTATSTKLPSATTKAKGFISSGGSNASPTQQKTVDTKTREEIINRACRAINASATNVGLIVDGESYRDCIKSIATNQNLNSIFLDRVGVTADTVIEILEAGVFPNEPILDCIVQNTRREQPKMNFFG